MHTSLRRTDRTSSTVRSHCFLPRAALVDQSTLTFFRSAHFLTVPAREHGENRVCRVQEDLQWQSATMLGFRCRGET